MVLYPVIPESPFYLVSAGHMERAEAVLRRMARANGKSMPPGRLRGGIARSEVSRLLAMNLAADCIELNVMAVQVFILKLFT